MEGPNIDLVALARLSLTDEQHDALTDCKWEEIVIECDGEIVETLEFEGGPGQSDTYYDVEIDDPAQFVDNLRRFYLSFLEAHGLALRSSAKRSRTKANQCVVIRVEWGNDLHDCPVAMRTWRRILKGTVVRRVEPYVYEGQRFVGEWHFNRDGFGTLVVNYDDGGVGFEGNLSEAIVTIGDEPVRWDEAVSTDY